MGDHAVLNPLLPECQPLVDAEAMLLVDNDEAEAREVDIVLKKSMSPDRESGLPPARSASAVVRSSFLSRPEIKPTLTPRGLSQ